MRWFPLIILFACGGLTYAAEKSTQLQKKMPAVPKRASSLLEKNLTRQESIAFGEYAVITKFVKRLLEMGYRSEVRPQYASTVIEVPSKTKKKLSSDYYFPDEVTLVESGNRQVLQYELMSSDSKVLDLCPTIDMNNNAISKITIYYTGMKFCLSAKTFAPHEPKKCDTEIQPVLIKKVLGNTSVGVSCGANSDGFLLAFAYVFCDEANVLAGCAESVRRNHVSQPSVELFPDNIPTISVYELCVISSPPNVNHIQQVTDPMRPSIIYTRHRIVPGVLRHEDDIAEQASDTVIPVEQLNEHTTNSQTKTEQSDTEFYHENLEKFKIMKKAFKVRKGIKYVPQMLVPTEDMAFPLQKKTTYTYFNIHALWNKLVPIMHLISERIRQLAIKNNRELAIYTRTFETKVNGYETMYLGDSRIVVPNIWCKIVHDIVNNFATTVIIHNTPYLPVQLQRLCSRSKLVQFNFENWWHENALFSKEQIEFGAKYAYCCEVTDRIKKTYGINMNFKNPIVDLAHNTNNKDDIPDDIADTEC